MQNPPAISVLMPDDETRNSFLPPEVKRELEAIGAVWWNPSETRLQGKALAKALDATVCVTGWGCAPLTEEVLANASRLCLMVHTGGSVAGVVTPAVYDHGIKVVSGNKLFAESVAEGVVAYMLCALRHIPYYNSRVHEGEWQNDSLGNEGLLDQTVGLIGFGAIARYLVPMLRAFRVTMYVYDPFVPDDIFASYGVTRAASMEEVFSACKIVSLHLPRTRETYHVINHDLLRRMPDGAILINTARGSVIDESALVSELQTGRISAVLDVFETEPLPVESGLRLPNAILMPHMAGPTMDRRSRIGKALVEDIRRFLSGEPLAHEIPFEYGMKMTNDSLAL